MTYSPWLQFRQETHIFCEQDVGGWIRFPADAWSSLFFCLIAIIIVLLAIRKRQKYLMYFGMIIFLEGITSFSYHATSTHLAGLLDLSTMFVIAFMIFVPVLWRSKILRVKNYWVIIFGGSITFLGLSLLNTNLGDYLFLTPIVASLILWIIQFKKNKTKMDLKLLFGVDLFLIAFVFVVLDIGKYWCPDNSFLQGEVFWHFFSAIAVLCLSFYLAKFKMPEWESGI